MSFLSGLKVFGQDIVKVFAWTQSPKGQAVVAAGEAVVETALPVSVPIINLANEWFAKAYQVESLAVAASQATGTGADKAAIAIQTITPQILQYAQEEGLQPRTAAQIQAANTAIVAFINAMTQPAA
jgi:hypothetical protein